MNRILKDYFTNIDNANFDILKNEEIKINFLTFQFVSACIALPYMDASNANTLDKNVVSFNDTHNDTGFDSHVNVNWEYKNNDSSLSDTFRSPDVLNEKENKLDALGF